MKEKRVVLKALFAVLALGLFFSCSQAVGGSEDTDIDLSDSSKATITGSDMIGCVVAFQGANDLYVVAEANETDIPLQCDRTAIGSWEKFTIVDAGDDYIAFQSMSNDLYVCADSSETGTPLLANRSDIGSWEKFTWLDQGDNEVVIQANVNSKYWKTSGDDDDDNTLTAGASSIYNRSTFTYEVISGTIGDDDDDEDTTTTGDYPTDIIPGISENWKLTLPVDENGDDSSDATQLSERNTDPWEIALDDLVDFEYQPYFQVDDGGVRFRAHCAGATTSGSYYPRSELRQEFEGGDNYWSVEDYQYLKTSLAVTYTPVEKPEVCLVQIHGPEDEPMRIQYHAEKGLYLVWNEDNKDYDEALDYTLGQEITVTTTVDDGSITCIITNEDTGNSYDRTWDSNDSTGYFKVGCYTQSTIFLNEYKGDDYEDETDEAYGEVIVYSIDLIEN